MAMHMSLLKYVSKVSAYTLLSRILGFFRDSIFAMSFGARSGFDLFLLAFKIPNMMRRIFAEGAFSQAFIPVLAEYEEQRHAERKAFMDAVFSCLVGVTIVLSIVVCVACELILRFGPEWITTGSRMYLFFRLLQITFPYLVLITATGFFTAALQSKKRFTMAALGPSIFNMVLIIGSYISSIHLAFPIYGAAATVILGGCIQVGMMFHSYHRLYGAPTLSIFKVDAGVLKMFKLMCAGIYGASVAQIGIAMDSVILSTLAAGSISWIYYAERLSYLPLGVFGVSIATVLTPSLAKSSQSQDQEAFQKQIAWGVISAGMIGVPAAIGLCLLAKPIVITLFFRGKFSMDDVMQTAAALQVFAIGIPAYMWIKVFAGAFYARQETWIPMRCATMALVVNLLVGCVGAYFLAHIGIAYAVVASAYSNAFLLYRNLYQGDVFCFREEDYVKLGKVCLASIFTMVSAWVVPPVAMWTELHSGHQLGYLLGAGTIVLLGYSAILWSLALDWRSPE